MRVERTVCDLGFQYPGRARAHEYTHALRTDSLACPSNCIHEAVRLQAELRDPIIATIECFEVRAYADTLDIGNPPDVRIEGHCLEIAGRKTRTASA